jgi:hypothetical protein
MTDMTIANEIDRQIGRRAFLMMGTTQKVADTRSLTFNVRGSSRCNRVIVSLSGDDTYTLEFLKIGRAPAFKIKTSGLLCGIYVNQLHDAIERETGLFLSLGTVRR